MKKGLFLLMLALAGVSTVQAQRFTDDLKRGLVAVPTGSSGNSTTNFVSWRKLADEYYDVTYNLYKDGQKVASELNVTCYNDGSNAYPTTYYKVAAVVNGVEQANKCDSVTPWTQDVYKLGDHRFCTGYIDIPLDTVYDRAGNDVTVNYEANDAEVADLDGDGEMEIIIKRLNTVDASISEKYGEMYSVKSKEFVVLDAYDVNWQTGKASLMWRIDCGPNMVSLNSTEIDIIAYDWDEDGKAEVVLRGADNMRMLDKDGKTVKYTVGDATVNNRDKMTSHTDQQYAWTHNGKEFLLYLNGQTGDKYQQMDYPLKRLESGESSENTAWGDSYGHRSSKYFMGAPFLDGRKASLFLARGIYTRHKMIALDLNRDSHQWSTRWTWNCNDKDSKWYGNGYHNFIVADVDEDGRDEIVYGSMVIDDNGHGLSTTGFGHGDAQHVSDFNPYRKGLEFFGCLEEKRGGYGCNYRDATTSEVLYKHDGTNDDGRCLMANFSNEYPGSLGRSTQSGMINTVTNSTVDALSGDSFIAWGNLNFRIYWDGDLCSEILNSPGTAKEACVVKPGYGRLYTSDGCNMNNDSKNNPCFQGDIIGDWREEIIVRCGGNIRVYTTGASTSYSMPSLWFDHQYRQAMVWQMMAYNQPPHLSYFLGELEGITVAPPSLTNRGRKEVYNGETISGSTTNHLLMAATGDMVVNVTDGAAPYVLTVNTPSWVQGSDSNTGITTTTYTHELRGGAFTGKMRLVKQGDGTLVLPKVNETYTGETNVWGGTLRFDGTLVSSKLWLNRFTTLLSDGGNFGGGITADYDSRIIPGGENNKGMITTTKLTLNHGARLVLDIYDNLTADRLNTDELVLNTKTGEAWENFGPEYLKPVVQFVAHGTLPAGRYHLGTVGKLTGSLDDLVVEGLDGQQNATLELLNDHLYLIVGNGDTAGSYVYFNDFETADGIMANDATIVGDGSFVDWGGNYGKVFQNATGGLRKNYLKLPEDVLSHAIDSKQLTIGFWVNAKNAGASTDYPWAPLFMAYGAAPQAGGNGAPMLACQYRGVVQVNNQGWCDYTNDNSLMNNTTYLYHSTLNGETVYPGNGGPDWLADGDWHYYTVVFDNELAKVYFDGVLKNSWDASMTTFEDNGKTYRNTQMGLFSNGIDLTYICLGGNQAWNWGDNDPGFAFDDVRITNKAMTAEEIVKLMNEKRNYWASVIDSNRGDLTAFVNGDFTENADGWTGGTWCNWVGTRGWRGGDGNAHYEISQTGSMSFTLKDMPAGTYKVVAAARTYAGCKITPQIAGTSGATLTGVGDDRNENSTTEINTNGVEMPYSSLGGFTSDDNGHNWRWISATGILKSDGDLVINFNGEGDHWMAIDDVHLYCVKMEQTTYCMTVETLTANKVVSNTKTVTCDLSVANPNVIFRTTNGAITTAAGEALNNNLHNTGGYVMYKMVLYDGFDFEDYQQSGGYRIHSATLYRSLPAGQWCTLMVPFYPLNVDSRMIPSQFNDGVLDFGNVTGMDWNGVPMMVKSNNGAAAVTGVRNGTYGIGYGKQVSGTGVTMVGTYKKIDAIEWSTDEVKNYVLGTDNNLHKVTSNVALRPFRAYFTLNESNSAQGRSLIYLNLDDEVTRIDGIQKEDTVGGAEMYNLNGQRVNAPKKGLYVVRQGEKGRKVIIK